MIIEKSTLQTFIIATKNGMDYSNPMISMSDLEDFRLWLIDRWENEFLVAEAHDELPPLAWTNEAQEIYQNVLAEIASRDPEAPIKFMGSGPNMNCVIVKSAFTD